MGSLVFISLVAFLDCDTCKIAPEGFFTTCVLELHYGLMQLPRQSRDGCGGGSAGEGDFQTALQVIWMHSCNNTTVGISAALLQNLVTA